MPELDFCVDYHGSIAILVPKTARAEFWTAEHLPADAMRWGGGVVIEPRYLSPILDGIVDDRLTWGD